MYGWEVRGCIFRRRHFAQLFEFNVGSGWVGVSVYFLVDFYYTVVCRMINLKRGISWFQFSLCFTLILWI